MENLSEAISRIIALDETAVEDAQSYPIELVEPSLSVVQEFVEAIDHLSQYIETGRANIYLKGDPDKYRIQYNPSEDIVITEQQQGGEYEIDNLYPGETNLIENLEDFRHDTVSDIELALDILKSIDQDYKYFDLSISYKLRKSNISKSISDSTTLDINSIVYFSEEKFLQDLQSKSPDSFRPSFLDEDKNCIFSIVNTDVALYSSVIGITSLGSTNSILSLMSDEESSWEDRLGEIATTALIENIDSILPPEAFNFQGVNGDSSEIESIFFRHRLLFSLLSISSSARQLEEGKWEVLIQGKQFIEGIIDFPDHNEIRIDKEIYINITSETVASVGNLYEWVYSDNQSENRVDILRNVITLYARSLSEVISDAELILSSSNSNLRYYRRESVDEFVNFRQEMIESVIQTQRQYSDLSSELMTNLSRDLFRTFGFIIVIAAGLAVRAGDYFSDSTIALLITTMVTGYIAVTCRRIRGIEKQYIRQTKSHKNIEGFYSRFFDSDELKELGVSLSQEEPRFLDSYILPNQGEDEMTQRLRRDIAMYYGLIVFLTSTLVVVLLFLFTDILTNLSDQLVSLYP